MKRVSIFIVWCCCSWNCGHRRTGWPRKKIIKICRTGMTVGTRHPAFTYKFHVTAQAWILDAKPRSGADFRSQCRGPGLEKPGPVVPGCPGGNENMEQGCKSQCTIPEGRKFVLDDSNLSFGLGRRARSG